MSTFPVNIFLPAAGLGERLRPITSHLPKPLLPVLGRPIIEMILEKIAPVCSGTIGINLHYKPELLREWAERSPYADRIHFFDENPILGTGGALKNAEPLLSRAPFIVHNSDILLDIDFQGLIAAHISSGNIATLVCHRIPELSNVVIDKKNQVLDVENAGTSRPDPATKADKIAYTGIAVYSPEILGFLPTGVSHATVAWIAASRAGFNVRAVDVTGCSWHDIGNPVTYSRAMLDALRNTGETVYVSPSAHCGRISIDGYIVLESGSTVEDGARLRNCVVMPGARVSGEQENMILGPDYAISLSETDMQPSLHAVEQKQISLTEPFFSGYFTETSSETTGLDVSRHGHPAIQQQKTGIWSNAILIGLGGSDRRYFRVRNDHTSAVLMECSPDDPDYERHIMYTRFFSAHTMPVPGLLATDSAHKCALFEDLGDASLYACMKPPRDSGYISDVYSRVLDILLKLHTRITNHVHECPMLRERIFDYEYLRWETSYFLDRFVIGLRNTPPKNRKDLEQEFHHLAHRTDSFPKSVIHRDFQCQNIMMTRNGIPRVIDFQGARMAPAAYDVASILWDPYHRLEDGVREKLLAYYVQERKKDSPEFDEKIFMESLALCRLQRHMQALGAYGFLSVVKGKKYFLKHVPEALRLLKDDLSGMQNEYLVLCRLVDHLQR